MKFGDYLLNVYILYIKLLSVPLLNFFINSLTQQDIWKYIMFGITSLCWIIAVLIIELKIIMEVKNKNN